MKGVTRYLFAMLAFAGASLVNAQGYPNKPVKVVIPWPPGQATDVAARLVSEKLGAVLGQQFVRAAARCRERLANAVGDGVGHGNIWERYGARKA